MTLIPSFPGVELVLRALGCWPAFHDAEVIRFSLARGATPEANQSDLELDVQIREYETRHEGTAQYELVQIKNVLIEFSFAGVEGVQVEDFNFHNVIDSLTLDNEVSDGGERIRVQVESIYGFGAAWLCRSAKVKDVCHLAIKVS